MGLGAILYQAFTFVFEEILLGDLFTSDPNTNKTYYFAIWSTNSETKYPREGFLTLTINTNTVNQDMQHPILDHVDTRRAAD